jgi:hypothetical protein
MKPISAPLAKLEAMLIEADGEFVAGQLFAKAVGIPMMNLSNFIKPLRDARPNRMIEGRRGKGYRAGSLAQRRSVAASIPTPAERQRQYRAATNIHRRLATNMAMLDLLPPGAAELVKAIALDTGETADACLFRLVSYGVEVHHDLVSHGQNPLGLVRSPMQVAA